jgi:glycosyltransferase involved in cell wall biosynthesis
MDRERDLTILIRSFALLKKQVATATLLMVGDGTERERLEECARDLGVDGGILFTGRVRPEEIPDYIDAAQIGVSVIPPLDVYKLSSPIKMLEYMAMGRPVVANEEIPEQKEAVDASCGGVLVKYDPESIAAGMLALCEDPVRAGEMGERGREWIVKNRSYEAMARRLEERYLDLKKGSVAFPD